ncbi:hypothetical protein CFOL_v3_07898 [Cephalotus follicularis]|uniref:Uncharacterized protein n=1 Tax=Cephalotus follicularis TaxID=3775 RepID=A0A1Q3B8T8_CEPFO|nr:hypothetical protein CFOL_v3_07898 [Cephalotus follicularis]
MLGLKSLTYPPTSSLMKPISIPLHNNLTVPTYLLKLKLQPLIPKTPSTKRILVLAQNNENDNHGNNSNLTKQPNKTENQGQPKNGFNGVRGDEDMKKDGRPIFNFKLGDLLDPDPDNILAVGLTGLLAWAGVQVLSQLFFISLAILVAALKYSFIAALLIFILITLL